MWPPSKSQTLNFSAARNLIPLKTRDTLADKNGPHCSTALNGCGMANLADNNAGKDSWDLLQ